MSALITKIGPDRPTQILPDVDVVFCSKCGCHYTYCCGTHDFEDQKSIVPDLEKRAALHRGKSKR
jgi:hypothetical protein